MDISVNKIIGITAGVIGIITAIVTLTLYFYDLTSRVRDLEGQVQAIYQSSFSSDVAPSERESGAQEVSSQPVSAVNISELTETCSQLAIRVADAYDAIQPLTVAGPLEKMMERLGCNRLIPEQ